MKTSLLTCFCLISSFLYSKDSGILEYQIDAFGGVDCKVEMTFEDPEKSSKFILLPFRINSDAQLRIPDDIVYSFKKISRKYTLLTLIVPPDLKKFTFSVASINNSEPAPGGRAKVTADFSYKDIPSVLKKMLLNNDLFYQFSIKWTTPKKLELEEISRYPEGKVKADSSNSFFIAFSSLESDRRTWFSYPNFKSSNDQNIQFLVLLLIGIVTGLAQLTPILERKSKTVKYQGIAGVVLLIAIVALYILIPKESFIIVKQVSAPIIPHIVYILGGLIYINVTAKFLHKISGIVEDEFGKPLRYADIGLYKIESDVFNDKPIKELIELDNGRFEFKFLDKSMKAYKIKISKDNRETILNDIPLNRAKAYELPKVIILKKTESRENEEEEAK